MAAHTTGAGATQGTAGASATYTTTGADATIAAGAGAIQRAQPEPLPRITTGDAAMYSSNGAGAVITTGAGAMYTFAGAGVLTQPLAHVL